MKLRLIFIALILLLSGCAGLIDGISSAFGGSSCPTEGNTKPPISEAVLRQAWGDKFGKLPAKYDDSHWTWNVVSVDDLKRICGQTLVNGVYKDAAGCTDSTTACPATYTTADLANSKLLVTHEIAHIFLYWSKGNSDPTHTVYPDVWTKFVGMFGP